MRISGPVTPVILRGETTNGIDEITETYAGTPKSE